MFIAVCTGEKEKQAPQSYITLNDGLAGNSRGQHFCQSRLTSHEIEVIHKKRKKLQTKYQCKTSAVIIIQNFWQKLYISFHNIKSLQIIKLLNKSAQVNTKYSLEY